MPDLSGNPETITLTADITDQVRSIDEKKKAWLEQKAQLILSSENPSKLIINLIEDFNLAFQATKQIHKISKDAVNRKTTTGLRSGLVEIVRFFEPDFLPEK